MSAFTPAHSATMPASEDLLEVLFNVSMTGVILFQPVFAADGTEIVDLAYVRLNAAAQQMLRLPERPAQSFLALYPHARPTGVFDFYCQAFQSTVIKRHQFNYQHDGLDAYFHLAAQRSGSLLVVNFTDTNDQPRTAVEDALRQAQAREQIALAEAEAQRANLARLFQQAPAAICVLAGADLTFELVNPLHQRLFPGRELLGRPLREALPELWDHARGQILRQVYATGEAHETPKITVPMSRVENEPVEDIYFHNVTQPRRNAQGQVDGLLLFTFDVTEQVLARQQVEQLNHQLEAARAGAERERGQLQALIAQAPVAIGLFEGDDLRITSVNAVISALWGYTPAQVLGRPLLEAVPELQGQGFDDLLRQVLHTQVPYVGTETPATLRRDGQLHTTYFNFVYQPLYGAKGQVTGVLCVAVDVTEQVVARQQVQTLNEELAAINEELRASNEEYQLANVALSEVQRQLRHLNEELEARVQQRTQALHAQQTEQRRLFAQAPMAIVVLRGPQFIIEQANAQAEIIWGVAAADVLGRPHFEAIPGSGGQGFEEMLTGVLTSGEAVVVREMPIELARAHTGQPAVGYYNIIFKPLRDENQRVSSIAVMWTETTDQVLARQQVQELNEELAAINEELRASNEELNESNTQLTRTNVDLDTFVYTASHDLKAPITNIESITLALRETLPAEVQQDALVAHLLDLLAQTTARFQFTIGQLTDISRLQLAHAGPAEPVHLAAVVEAVRLDLAPLIAAAGAQLTVNVPADLVASFSPANLRSAVYNLLSNAVKYRALDRAAQVRVYAARTGQGVVLTVQDNGLGMSEMQQRQLFGLFQRLHTHVEGTGVGLYITKRLVENGGGTIAVESQVDVGTTFTLTFPA